MVSKGNEKPAGATPAMSAGSVYVQKLHETADFLRTFARDPEVAIVLGSGLGDLARHFDNPLEVDYPSIPHFPTTTVAGHEGKLIFGTLEGTRVVAMKGRAHCYEGYSAADAAYGVRALAFLGVRKFVLTTATGGLNPGFEVGDLMLIENHITLFCEDPSLGLQHAELGETFYPQTDPYNLAAYERLDRAAKDAGIRLRKGVHCFFSGPRYESRADIRALRVLGADAVSMSTVPEALALNNLGIKDIAGITLITNLAAGIAGSDPSHEEVLAAGAAAKPRFEKLVRLLLKVL